MKKVVNSVLASALALTVAPMVVGAEEAQQTTAPQIDPALDKVVKRLSALGLVEGMGNGDYAIDKNVTRAQFATLVVRARGLASGVALAQNEQRFVDVKSSDWFSGWVNVAAGQELVKGYPNNAFGPGNNVTYAEAVAMIIRALGYDVAVKGVWPNNYIAKAAELGISKGVKIDPNKPATRGDIFLMLDNSLNIDLMKQDEYGSGDLGYHVSKGDTLLTEYLDVDVYDMDWANTKDKDVEDLPFVSNVPVTGLGTLKANEVTFAKTSGSPISGTYKVADGINPNEFGGQHVQVWVKDDREDTIVWMEPSENEEVVNDKLDIFLYDDKNLQQDDKHEWKTKLENLTDLEIRLDSGKTYRFAKNAQFTYNYQRYAAKGKDWKDFLKDVYAAYGTDWDSYRVKLVLNDDGDVSYISLVDDVTADKVAGNDFKFGSEVIKKVDVDKQKIYTLSGTDVDLKGDEEGKDFIVFRNGLPAKLADLKEMDVYTVYYADGDKDHKIIVANSTVVEGKVDDVQYRYEKGGRNGYFLKIGDKTYRLRATTFSDDKNKTIEDWTDDDTDKIKDLEGLDVKLYLDTTGRVRHIETSTPVKERRVRAVLTKDVYYDEGKDEYSLTVYNEKDAKATLVVKDEEDFKGLRSDGKDATNADIMNAFKVEPGKPVVVEYELDKDGDVKEVELIKDDLVRVDKDAWDKAADEDDNVIKVGGKTYDVADDAVVFDMTGDVEPINSSRNEYKDVDVAKFKDIADDDYEVLLSIKDGEVEYMYVLDGDKSIASSGEYGLVYNFSTSGGDDYVNIVTKDGSVQRYKLDGTVNGKFARFDTIRYELNSDNEVVVKDTYRVVNSDDDTPETTVIDPRVWDHVGDDEDIESIDVAHITDIDGRKVTYENAQGDKQYFYTTSSTVYYDVDGLSTKSGVDEGDYVVLIDTDDDGSAIDYVVFVVNQDDVDENNYDMSAFLGGKVTPPPADGVDLTGLNASEQVIIAKALSKYTITGTVSDKTAEITVEGDDVNNEKVTINDDGTFTITFTGKGGQTSFDVTAAVGDKKDTETVTVK